MNRAELEALAEVSAKELTALRDTIYEPRQGKRTNPRGSFLSSAGGRKRKTNKLHRSRMLKRKHARK